MYEEDTYVHMYEEDTYVQESRHIRTHVSASY